MFKPSKTAISLGENCQMLVRICQINLPFDTSKPITYWQFHWVQPHIVTKMYDFLRSRTLNSASTIISHETNDSTLTQASVPAVPSTCPTTHSSPLRGLQKPPAAVSSPGSQMSLHLRQLIVKIQIIHENTPKRRKRKPVMCHQSYQTKLP